MNQNSDAKEIAFPEGFNEIREIVADAVHEAWMEGKLEAGWSYGEKKDDALKRDPRICPYSELSEYEKNFDRRTAAATIKTLLENGYTIERH